MSLTTVKECQNLSRTVWPTVIGLVAIESCANGLHAMQILERPQPDDGTNRKNFQAHNPNEGTDFDDINQKTAKIVVQWLEDYFGNKESNSIQQPNHYPNICWTGLKMTEFESLVWKTALENVKFGETVSYGQLAALMDKPKAVRAVGTALKKNPIFLIIPCHRIVRSNGNAGNYSGGKMNDVKEFLIQHEQKS